MTDAAVVPQTGGVSIDVKDVKVSLSDKAFETFARMWRDALDWAATNKLQFMAVLLVVALCVVTRRRTKVELEALKGDYAIRRDQAKRSSEAAARRRAANKK